LHATVDIPADNKDRPLGMHDSFAQAAEISLAVDQQGKAIGMFDPPAIFSGCETCAFGRLPRSQRRDPLE
jgi:hypothetical protein